MRKKNSPPRTSLRSAIQATDSTRSGWMAKTAATMALGQKATYCPLSPWERAGVRAVGSAARKALPSPPAPLSKGRGETRRRAEPQQQSEEQASREPVENQVDDMLPAGAEAELAIGHVREPCQRMSVAGVGPRECPEHAAKRQAVEYIRILRDVVRIVELDVGKMHRLAESEIDAHEQQSVDEESLSFHSLGTTRHRRRGLLVKRAINTLRLARAGEEPLLHFGEPGGGRQSIGAELFHLAVTTIIEDGTVDA